jgi:hypothetical protein
MLKFKKKVLTMDDKTENTVNPEPISSTPSEPTVASDPLQTNEPPAPARGSRRKKLLIIGGVVIAVTAVSLAALFLLRDTVPPKASQSTQVEDKKLGVAIGLTEGLVQYSSDAQSWKDVSPDTDLKEGDSVRTATGGRVVLLIDDGSAVRLDGESEIRLSSLNVNSVVINNTSGEVYSRVVASETREYKVRVGDETYEAKGTAYRTFNEATKKGVEVFHSAVQAVTENKEVTEGKYLFSKHEQADRQGVVLALDVEALKADDFIKWNTEQDKKVSDYADKLGILDELDKPAPAPAPIPKAVSTAGITLTGKQSEYSAVFSWKVNGVDTSKGFKLVRSSKTTTPTYPDNSVAYIETGKTSYTLYVGDDTKYNYRICAYRDKGCESYSNTVTITTLKKVSETVQPGAVTLALNGNALSWTFAGTAPYGFKVVAGTSSGPTYSNNYKKYYTEDTNYNLSSSEFTSGTSYYIKVCKYSDGTCTDYSNEVVYTP